MDNQHPWTNFQNMPEVVKVEDDRNILQLLRPAILHRCAVLLRLDRNTAISVKQLDSWPL